MSINAFITDAVDFIGPDAGRAVVVLLGSLLIGWLAARAISSFVARTTHSDPPIILRRLVFYIFVVIGVIGALNQLGFDLGVLLGAAGILTVAVGFAAQTSFSNIISGLFLIGERPFVLNDIVQVGQTTGRVHSIDLMSVTLRTFDNLFVRIPNEMIIKSEITNMSRFPIRRADLLLRVGLDENLDEVYAILRELAHEYPLCLEEPSEVFVFKGFTASSIDFQFSVWATQEDFYVVRNELPLKVKEKLEEHGVRLPVPRSEVHVAETTRDSSAAVAAAAIPAETS